MAQSGALRLVLGLATIAIIFLALNGSLRLSAGAQPTLRIEPNELAISGSGAVTLQAVDMPAPGLGAWSVDVQFDQLVVYIDSCVPQNSSVCIVTGPDSMQISGAVSSGLEGDTNLATLTFNCRKGGSSPLTLDPLALMDATVGNPQPIETGIIHGKLTCPNGTPTPVVTGPARVIVGSASIRIEEQGTAAVEARNISGLRLWIVDVNYDWDALRVVSCTPRDGSVCNQDFAQGTVRFAGSSEEGLFGTFPLGTLTLECDEVGESILSPHLETFNSDLLLNSPISAETRASEVDCLPQMAGGGIGDVNCNGVANAIDAALLLQFAANFLSALPCPQNADANLNGIVDVIDASLILQYDAGFLTHLPP